MNNQSEVLNDNSQSYKSNLYHMNNQSDALNVNIEKLIDENKQTKLQNTELQNVIKDLEIKLNCLIQNKDLYEQVLTRNQSLDDNETYLK